MRADNKCQLLIRFSLLPPYLSLHDVQYMPPSSSMARHGHSLDRFALVDLEDCRGRLLGARQHSIVQSCDTVC